LECSGKKGRLLPGLSLLFEFSLSGYELMNKDQMTLVSLMFNFKKVIKQKLHIRTVMKEKLIVTYQLNVNVIDLTIQGLT